MSPPKHKLDGDLHHPARDCHRCSVVRVSVCALDTIVSPAEADEPIENAFQHWLPIVCRIKRGRRSADTIGTVLVSRAGHF